MIRLTQRANGAEFYVAPDAIQATGAYERRVGGDEFEVINYVCYQGDGGDGVEIREQPIDVARLRAAWELRYAASELDGTLPMAIYMDETGDEPAIRFMCCALTQKLKERREAEAAAQAEAAQ